MADLIARDALGTLTRLGQGGQGVVYQAPKVKAKFADRMVFKEYKPQARGEVDFEALSAMPTLVEETLSHDDGKGLVSVAAWPCALVEGDTGPVGFVMPAIPDSFQFDLTTVKGRSPTISEFQHLLNPASVLAARGITITDEQRYQLVREVAKALSFLHRIGVCVGDISPKNVLFSLEPRPAVYFVDCDTMRVNGVSALLQRETPEWQVPAGEELATIYSDTYKLGLLALRLLVGDQHTKNPQDLPATTPKPLRQLITDTLTKEPADRPVPQAWDYLLGQIIDNAQQKTTTLPIDPPRPASPSYSLEPTPVVRSRPADSGAQTQTVAKHAKQQSAPASSPAPSVTGLALTSNQKMYLAAAVTVPVLLIITIMILVAGANQGSNGTPSSPAPAMNTGNASKTSEQTVRPPDPALISNSDPLQWLLSHIPPNLNCTETYLNQNGALAEVHCFPSDGVVDRVNYRLEDDPAHLDPETYAKRFNASCPATSQVKGFNWYRDGKVQGVIGCSDFPNGSSISFSHNEFQITGYIQGLRYGGVGVGPAYEWWRDRYTPSP